MIGFDFTHAWLLAQVQSSTFSQNTAKSSGSVLLADDDSQISFVGCTITNNGNYSCYDPPTVSPLSIQCNMPGKLSLRHKTPQLY